MSREYVLFPSGEYPGDAYPYSVGEVDADVELVHSPLGSEWELVTEEEMTKLSDVIQDIIGASSNVAGSMDVPLDKLVTSQESLIVDLAVVKELWARIMKADSGEFLKLNADLIGANQIRADHLEAGVFNGQVIVGAEIKTAESGARVELSGDALQAYDANGRPTVSIRGGRASITAGEFKTSEDGTRVEMTSEHGLRVLHRGDVRFQAHHSLPYGCGFWEPMSGELRSPSQVIFGARIFEFQGMKTCTAASTAGGWTFWDFDEYGFYAPCSRAIAICSVDYYCGGGPQAGARTAITLRFNEDAGEHDIPTNSFNEWPILDSGRGAVLNADGEVTGVHTSEQAFNYTLEHAFGMLPSYASASLVRLKPGVWYWPRIQFGLKNSSASGMTNGALASSSRFGNARVALIPC